MAVELSGDQLTAIATMVVAPIAVGVFAICQEVLKARRPASRPEQIELVLRQLGEDLTRIERWQERIIDRLDDLAKLHLMRQS